MYKNPEVKTFEELKTKQDSLLGIFSRKFDEVVSFAGINKQQNKQWADEYYSLKNNIDKLQKKLKRLKVWKWVLIPFVFPFVIMNSKQKKLQPQVDNFKQELQKLADKLEDQLKSIKYAFGFDWINDNVLNSWEDVKLNLLFFDSSANDLEDEYDSFMSDTSNCKDLVAGQMFEHPFALFNKKEQLWKDEVYTNSVTLPYTARMNGQTTTMFETVVGTFVHPAPYWNVDTKLVYKNSFNPKLSFTTNCSKKEFKKLEKSSQVSLENPQFNKNVRVIRNDETGIRVVFTPLAQESLNKLFAKRKYWLTKSNNATIVDLPENHPVLSHPTFFGFDYDLERWKDNLSQQLFSFTDILGTFSLPIANMPVYFQINNKPVKKHNFLRLQAQSDMNYLYDCGIINFETDAIFEPVEVQHKKIKNSLFNVYKINCRYFDPQRRTTTVMEPSMHHGIVPIHVDYIDYQPLTQTVYLLQSIKLDLKISLKDCFAHNGQILALSHKPFSSDLSEVIK